MARILDDELLEQLDGRLEADGARPGRRVRPGISREEVRAQVSRLGMPTPEELITWWSRKTFDEGSILPRCQYVTLEQAVAEYQRRRNYAAEAKRPPGWAVDDWWNSAWLPIFAMDGGMVFVADLGQSAQVAPIHLIDWQAIGSESVSRSCADSLGDFIAGGLDEVNRGAFAYREPAGYMPTGAPPVT